MGDEMLQECQETAVTAIEKHSASNEVWDTLVHNSCWWIHAYTYEYTYTHTHISDECVIECLRCDCVCGDIADAECLHAHVICVSSKCAHTRQEPRGKDPSTRRLCSFYNKDKATFRPLFFVGVNTTCAKAHTYVHWLLSLSYERLIFTAPVPTKTRTLYTCRKYAQTRTHKELPSTWRILSTKSLDQLGKCVAQPQRAYNERVYARDEASE